MLKRIIITTAVLVLVSESIAFATGSLPGASSSFNYNLSSNVTMSYYSDLSNYVMNAKHFAGNRVFSASNNSSAIWYQENANYVTKVVTEGTIPNEESPGESTYSGWSSL